MCKTPAEARSRAWWLVRGEPGKKASRVTYPGTFLTHEYHTSEQSDNFAYQLKGTWGLRYPPPAVVPGRHGPHVPRLMNSLASRGRGACGGVPGLVG